MTTLSITDPDFRELLEEALSDGHHASAGISTTSLETATEVIEVAEDVAVERLDGDEPEVARRLAVLRGLAALLYDGEQQLLAKIDQLEERVRGLRSALAKVASASNLDVIESIARLAKGALDNDDADAAEDTPTEPPPPPAPVTARRPALSLAPTDAPDPDVLRVHRAITDALLHPDAVPLRRGPFLQKTDGTLCRRGHALAFATPMGLVAFIGGLPAGAAGIPFAAKILGVDRHVARVIDDGFLGEPCDLEYARWHQLGQQIAREAGVESVPAQGEG